MLPVGRQLGIWKIVGYTPVHTLVAPIECNYSVCIFVVVGIKNLEKERSDLDRTEAGDTMLE